MALRGLLLIAAALAAATAPAAAFYLPGLAPVNFCEAGKEKPECKVSPGGAEGRPPRPPGCGAALGVVPLLRGLRRGVCPEGLEPPRHAVPGLSGGAGAVAAGTPSVVRFPLCSSCSQNC